MQHLCPFAIYELHTTWYFAQFGLFQSPQQKAFSKGQVKQSYMESLVPICNFIHRIHKKILRWHPTVTHLTYLLLQRCPHKQRAEPHPFAVAIPSHASHHLPTSPLLDRGFRSTSSEYILHFGSHCFSHQAEKTLFLHTFSCAKPEKRLKFKHKAWAGAVLSRAGNKCLLEPGEKPPRPPTSRGQTQSIRCINTRAPLHGTQGFLSQLKHVNT